MEQTPDLSSVTTASATEPDLSSVTTLTKHPTALARQLKLTPYAITRWRKVNRIPGKHVIAVANFYNVEVIDLLPLTGSDLSLVVNPLMKPRDTLPTLINVQKGLLTKEQACTILGLPMKSVVLVLTHWGEKLEALYEILTRVELGVMSIDQACQQLGVNKISFHVIRKKYGFAPGARTAKTQKSTLPARQDTSLKAALRVIRGQDSAKSVAKDTGISVRTLFRKIEAISNLKIHDLTEFPTTFRAAYADEIEKNLPKIVENWLKIAKDNKFFIRKTTKYPQTPKTWRDATVQRMLVGVLLSEATLDEIAASKGADPGILKGIFTSHLRLVNTTWAQVEVMGMNHQMALAELLLWSMDRMRKVTE